MINVKGLCFAYEDDDVLSEISLDIKRGTTLVLLGPSGCGKSTLCKCLCGIIPKVVDGDFKGFIEIDGEDISKTKLSVLIEKVGLVMQEPDHQIVQTTVEDDIAFAPENLCVEPDEIRQRVDSVLDKLNISHMGLRNPSTLSGGEKQRVAIGGILSLNTDVLIFDEPMSSLDTGGKKIFVETVKELHDMGKTVIVAEHDYDLLDFADKWIAMDDGRIVKEGEPWQ